ncbi:hypothetical protein [Candidatus Palauibacter sp.]|uniref:hypothetical protein n=1 Tax=Candidatus Palauibacter sp. TaxID=3101350 RepID=UPI003C6F8A0F
MSIPNPHRFGDLVTPNDILRRIAKADWLADSGDEGTAYYYGRFVALLCAFDIMGELMDRSSREELMHRLSACHERAKDLEAFSEDRRVEEAGNYFLLLATHVQLGACAAGARRKPSDAARGVSRAEVSVVFRTGTRCRRGDGPAGGVRAGPRTSFCAPGDA